LLLADSQFLIRGMLSPSARQFPYWLCRLSAVVVPCLESRVWDVGILLPGQKSHAYLFPLSDAGSRFPLAQALGWHRRGHGVVVLIVAVGSLASVAVELQLVAVINNLPVQAKYVVCPVPVVC